MKRYFSVLAAAFVLIFFNACDKQEVNSVDSYFDGTFVFNSAKPEVVEDIATRTGWTGSSVQWLKDDRIRIAFKVDNEWQGKDGEDAVRIYASKPLTADTDKASFEVPTEFNKDYSSMSKSKFEFFGLYPSKAVSSTTISNPPSVTISIPNEQTPKEDSFDATADILVGKAETTGKPTEALLMSWNRIVALGQITLKNLKVTDDEAFETVTFTAQEGADLVGSHSLDIVEGTVSNPKGTNNVITVNASGLKLAEDKSLKVWIGLLPETITSLTVTVETNKAVYTREITGISKTFVKNKRNVLGIKMDSATRVEKEVTPVAYPYSASLSELGDFTIENVIIPEDLTYVWTIDTGNKYAKASAYKGSAYASEALLISPYIDMSGSVNPILTFKHTSKFFTDIQRETAVLVRVQGSDSWSALEVDKYPTNNDWTFVDATASLEAYKNNVIQIAFKYTSTDTAAGTWEIKNFKIDEAAGNTTTVTIKSTHTGTAVQDLESLTESAGAIKAIFSKNNAQNGIYESQQQIRVYVGNTITLTGGTINKVVITCSGDSYNKGFTVESGSTTSSGATWTWTGSSTSLVLTSLGSSRITSIDVTYE